MKNQALRSIACILHVFDAWTLSTFETASRSREDHITKGLFSRFQGLTNRAIENMAWMDDNVYEARCVDEHQNRLEDLTETAITEILCDLRTSQYYAQLIQLRTILYATAEGQRKYALTASDVEVPDELDDRKIDSFQTYIGALTRKSSEEKQKLEAVITYCWTLRNRIKHAAELGELTPTLLEALKKKMIALQVNIRSACTETGMEAWPLIDENKAEWWELGDGKKETKNDLSKPPHNAVDAYPRSNNLNAALSFTVPAICLLSCIPAGIAWSHTRVQVGSYNDGNFYQLLSSSAMQLLGIGTLIWPTLFSGRLVGLPRILAWILACTSILCTIISMPLYLYAPTTWSGMLSFCGNVAQTLVLLQLVYSL
ncbi:hypothetical protein NA56DRAFT_324166 [Hyaloscypha hepaticicola]|uniref:MFS general substrate transporter n=1 Tax=Hyaloscypha hepaticicola TaxID=2082293 RepID=A0A2J6PPJ9_9HELO|nr:hypothetical protein NA56DRAFT_324166 [Hyaloscypha hepaticicola]